MVLLEWRERWMYSRTWGETADQSYVSVTVVRDGPVASRW
ncbi:MAG: hypothetical protein QOJ19_3746 [Acidimicrobiia bacterium]|nr:hypothetical protein [Acidimicrobiia bacterium]